MTKEAAIEILFSYLPKDEPMNADDRKAFDKAIAALKVEPCEDAVSKADILQKYDKYCEDNCPYSKKQRDVMCGACFMGDAIEIVEALPSVTPKQRTGKWISIRNKKGTEIAVRCDCCGNSPKHAIRSDYCPNCGEKMEGE